MSASYDGAGRDIGDVVDQRVGDCSEVARDYAALRYGEDALEQNREEVDEIIQEYGDPQTGFLSREDFFENVKSGIDELLTQ